LKISKSLPIETHQVIFTPMPEPKEEEKNDELGSSISGGENSF